MYLRILLGVDSLVDLVKMLKKYNQEHLLGFYDELDEDGKTNLISQIKGIDFELISDLYEMAQKGSDEKTDPSDIQPMAYTDKDEISSVNKDRYKAIGRKICENGEYAVVTMAGGQGTRLGHTGPKGTFDIGIGKSLFEIQCERIRNMGFNVPWYIMTSKENDADTKAFFEANNYFGYDKENIIFFTQRMLPMMLENGRIVLEEKNRIKEGADGHGGIFRAMIESGVLGDMKRRNIKWIFTCGIDNVLTRPNDLMFLGYVSEKGSMIGCKSLVKRGPSEKVGVFCKIKGKPSVIEYTEISEEMANMRDEKGNLVYGDAHILLNLFNISVFEKMGGRGLPYHVALKKTDYINEKGEKVLADKPNAYKFEAFIFDAFSYFDDIAILRVKREEEFAPVKNKEGEDSPKTALELYLNADK